MSNDQDNLETKLSDAKAVAGGMLSKNKHVSASGTTAVGVAKTGSIKDLILWLLAAAVLIGATLVNQVCLALTHQGRAFKILLKDAAVELRRVTWPGKDETFQYTWQVIVVIAIAGFFIWLLDNFFNWFVGIFIG